MGGEEEGGRGLFTIGMDHPADNPDDMTYQPHRYLPLLTRSCDDVSASQQTPNYTVFSGVHMLWLKITRGCGIYQICRYEG